MRPFAVIDSETDPFLKGRIPEPFVWGFYDGREFRHYTHETVHSMIEWIADQKIIVYAHNGGKFDYHFLLPYMEPFDNVKIINGRIAQFYIGKAEFRDSINILPVALKKFEMQDVHGNTIKKQEFDYSLMEKGERYKPENWESIIDYLRDDCVTLYEAIKAFQSQYGRHLTQAGAAMAQWKKISKTKIPKSTGEYFEKFKSYYYGGRVQCFRRGIIEGNFSVFDINSAYPYAMLSKHPYGLDYIETAGQDFSGDYVGHGFYRIKAQSLGAFPYREKNGLTFPDDGEIREFHVTGWEVLAAIETDSANGLEVLSEIRHVELQDFSEYIEYFYQQRLTAKATGDKAGDLFAKLLMNSLYGKFGANPENYANYVILPPEEMDNLLDPTNEYQMSGELGPWLLGERELDDEEMRYYNAATAASITGFVRAYLWKAIHKTGRENMLYCDTDSIATLDSGNALDTGKELGKWKHEGEFCRAGIGGKKMYVFEHKPPYAKNPETGKTVRYKTASKGVSLTPEQLWKVAQGETVIHEPDAPTFSVHKSLRDKSGNPQCFISRKIKLTL